MPAIAEEQAILEKAKVLATALGNAAPFRNCQRALKEYQDDPSAASLVAEFSRLQQEVSTHEQLWGEPDAHRYGQLETLRARLDAHPVVRRVREAESALLDLFLGSVLRLGMLTGVDYVEACTGRGLSGCGPGRLPMEIMDALNSVPQVSSALDDLGKSICQLAAYRRFEQTRDTFQNDPSVKQLREEMQAGQQRYLQARNDGSLNAEVIDQVRATQRRLQVNPAILQFGQARRDLYELLQTVNRTVSETLGMDVAQMLAPSGGCCG